MFVSDLHLAAERPAIVQRFVGLLQGRARQASQLYILGDLFDAWVGDDDDTPMHRAVIRALRGLTDSGTRCGLMHGNRDFLLGRRFARASGCTLLRDPTRILLDGEPVLLMHGDLLCTGDQAYLRFRRRVRNPLVQRLFLWQSLAKRRQVAADYRRRSGEAMAAKDARIMDTDQAEVVRRMRRAGVHRLVHGHTHRPAEHVFGLDGAEATRHVLADWNDQQGELLAQADGRWWRETLP
ncbi:UDP-2,3-diacylglucosamine diphosphatase [Thiohalocapsa marina]|uniref:UDP-2,3-diacylglucosamine hydrolase n=1 Tax=Thiohalocapsa marina TaxID=424902 RepID=A0A5M8FJ71_9GAMM|nr:UDP-2,3-diacylglucosamine diphosphatase [Thiohalocapsa marina]